MISYISIDERDGIMMLNHIDILFGSFDFNKNEPEGLK